MIKFTHPCAFYAFLAYLDMKLILSRRPSDAAHFPLSSHLYLISFRFIVDVERGRRTPKRWNIMPINWKLYGKFYDYNFINLAVRGDDSIWINRDKHNWREFICVLISQQQRAKMGEGANFCWVEKCSVSDISSSEFWVVEQGEKVFIFFSKNSSKQFIKRREKLKRWKMLDGGRETVAKLSAKVICPIRSWMRCLGIDNEKKYSRNLCAAWEKDESEKNFQDFTSHLVLLLVGGLWDGTHNVVLSVKNGEDKMKRK